MKRFIIVLFALLCAPLVAYAAWRLVGLFLLFCFDLKFFLVAPPVIFVVCCLILPFFQVYSERYHDWKQFLIRYNEKILSISNVLAATKNISEEDKNILIEKVNRYHDEKESAVLKSDLSRFSKPARDIFETVSIIFLIVIFFLTFIWGCIRFSDASIRGNIILTDHAIYSKNLVQITSGTCETINRNGVTYIKCSGSDGDTIYDLNGNIVEPKSNAPGAHLSVGQ